MKNLAIKDINQECDLFEDAFGPRKATEDYRYIQNTCSGFISEDVYGRHYYIDAEGAIYDQIEDAVKDFISEDKSVMAMHMGKIWSALEKRFHRANARAIVNETCAFDIFGWEDGTFEMSTVEMNRYIPGIGPKYRKILEIAILNCIFNYNTWVEETKPKKKKRKTRKEGKKS